MQKCSLYRCQTVCCLSNWNRAGGLLRARPEVDRMSLVRKELLEILACPRCKQPVEEVGEVLRCTGRDCGLEYPVRDGIPILLISEARGGGVAGCAVKG